MKVILKQTLPKVGKEGQVVSVKPGFARNFLFPKGMAVIADKSQVKALETRNARIASRLESTKAEAEALAGKLNGLTVNIAAKSADQGKLFGAVTSADIAEAINKEAGTSLDRKQVPMIQPIKRMGKFKTELDLHPKVDCFVNVVVYDEAEGLPTETVEAAPEVEEAVEAEEAN